MPERTGMVASALVIAALGVGVLTAGLSLPIDDFWLSLASARAIGEGAPLDRAIDLTWTPMRPGALNPQWGSQVVFGLGGGSAESALVINALLIGGGLALLGWRVRRQADVTATAFAMVIAIGVLAPHLLGRAQSFSILLAPVALLLLDLRPVPRWLPIAYGLLIAVWANLHGAFVIGQVAAVAALAGEGIDARRGGGSEPRGWRWLALTAVVALAAPLLNPAGLELLAYAYAQPGLEVVRSISVEWQPSWPWIPVATLFWALLALVLAGRILRRGAVSTHELVLLLGTALLGASSIRHIPWFVMVAAPVLARDSEAAIRASPVLARAIGVPARALRGRVLARLVVGGVVAVAALQPLRTGLPQSVGRVTPDAPVELTRTLEGRLVGGETARVLNEQVWGGYIAHRLGDRIETAMDGRLEIRDRATWAAYFALLHGEEDPAVVLRSNGVTWAALAADRTALIDGLRAAGWSLVVQAPEGVLLHDGP